MFDLSSDAATTIETMLMRLDNHTFLAEAAPAASVQPCRPSLGEMYRPGFALALSGSCAR